MADRGIHQIEMNDDVVLTELAYEKAERLGVNLIQAHQKPPAAPERPYISALSSAPKQLQLNTQDVKTDSDRVALLKKRVRETALQKLGTQVDPALLDKIIDRVVNNIGVS